MGDAAAAIVSASPGSSCAIRVSGKTTNQIGGIIAPSKRKSAPTSRDDFLLRCGKTRTTAPRGSRRPSRWKRSTKRVPTARVRLDALSRGFDDLTLLSRCHGGLDFPLKGASPPLQRTSSQRMISDDVPPFCRHPNTLHQDLRPSRGARGGPVFARTVATGLG
jgi:hypothetical protein